MQRSKKSGDASERGPSGARIASGRRKTKRGSSGRANGTLVRRLSRSKDGRERPAETQDGVRTPPSGQHSETRFPFAGRGTGPVKGTGFYEGSLSMEGTSGHTIHRLSRDDGDGGLGGFLTLETAEAPLPEKGRGRGRRRCEGSALEVQ
jgi:hypothetical protein